MCLPTPLKKNRSPEMKFINNSLNKIFPYLKKNQCISLEAQLIQEHVMMFVPMLKKKLSW